MSKLLLWAVKFMLTNDSRACCESSCIPLPSTDLVFFYYGVLLYIFTLTKHNGKGSIVEENTRKDSLSCFDCSVSLHVHR